MLNIMVFLYQFLGNNFILALVAFTVVTRLILLPLNLRQQHTKCSPRCRRFRRNTVTTRPK